MKFRAEALATAFAIAAFGIAKGVVIVVRTLSDAIDAAVTLPRTTDVPDYIPDALLVEQR